jgi:tetratricopeptide (TPR) repeat protein
MARNLRERRLRELEAQLTSDSGAISPRFERACLLAGAGRTDEAKGAYLEVLSREPSHRLALNNLGTLLHETGYRTAARIAYAEAVARHPGDPMSHVNLANVLRECGDLLDAREHYETALRLRPGYAEAHQGLGSVLAEAGDTEGAAGHWKSGSASGPWWLCLIAVRAPRCRCCY